MEAASYSQFRLPPQLPYDTPNVETNASIVHHCKQVKKDAAKSEPRKVKHLDRLCN